MKNQAIRDKYAALTVLSQRVLPSKTAINKVAALVTTRFQLPYESTERARKQILLAHQLPDGFEGDRMPMAIAEARQHAVDALMEEATPVRKIPGQLRLTSADLPKVLKGDGGEANVEGLAQIRIMLGSLYVSDADEKIIATDDDGEEPDAPTMPVDIPAAPRDEFAPAE